VKSGYTSVRMPSSENLNGSIIFEDIKMKDMKAERELSLDFLRVCEAAAIESAKPMGQGDRKHSDHVAVEAMRTVMDTLPMRGRIVIGEGERDEAPMLYIGEELGGGNFSAEARAEFPEVDIAVD